MKKLKKFLFLFLISTLLLFTISGSLYLYFFYSKSNELNKDIGSNPVVNESDSIFDEKKALNLIQDIQLSINQIYKKWEPAVIRIKIIKKEPVKNDKNDNSKNNNSLLIDNYFTGFFIDPNGLILTTYQNISDKNGKINESEIFVFFKDKKYPIQLIGKDIVSNLVLIKINHTNTPYIPILDIQPEKEIGNFCISIGKGFSFKKDDGFISFGVISGLDRIAYSVSDKYSLHKEFIQTDIPMVKENEGGPLFNIKGEFIGLNISFFGQTHNYGMGFSISINQIQKILPYLMKNKPIKRAFLGIIAGDLSQETKDFLKIKHGVIANNIIEGQAAEKFGIKTGDIILSIDDIKVNNSHHLIFIISSFLEEKTIKIKILRDNKEITLEVKLNTYLIEERDKISLEKNDNTSNKKKVLKWLGLHLIENKKDVQIKEIEKNSQASKATVPLKPGDIILSINLKEVNSIKFFSKIDHRKSFLIRVKRDNFEFFSLIKQK